MTCAGNDDKVGKLAVAVAMVIIVVNSVMVESDRGGYNKPMRAIS